MLKSVALQNFRNYKKSTFKFNHSIIIIGPNAVGKSNLIESIYLLSTGKSFRAEKDSQMVEFGKELGRVLAQTDEVKLEVTVTVGEVAGIKTQFKRFFVNGVAKRRVDFVGNLVSVLFSPQDLEVIVLSPSLRREFLDHVLEQTDRDYRIALLGFTKALRQRNALLDLVKNGMPRTDREFEYWDNLIIRNGSVLSKKREDFISWLNSSKKKILDIELEYDKSEISKVRLEKYYKEERASGNTLVGPHRDDLFIFLKGRRELKHFGSRGQQRLGILQLKLLELEYFRQKTGQEPLFLLDDVFSELDEGHINLILGIMDNQQTIITTTHEEFIPQKLKRKLEMIELKNGKV